MFKLARKLDAMTMSANLESKPMAVGDVFTDDVDGEGAGAPPAKKPKLALL